MPRVKGKAMGRDGRSASEKIKRGGSNAGRDGGESDDARNSAKWSQSGKRSRDPLAPLFDFRENPTTAASIARTQRDSDDKRNSARGSQSGSSSGRSHRICSSLGHPHGAQFDFPGNPATAGAAATGSPANTTDMSMFTHKDLAATLATVDAALGAISACDAVLQKPLASPARLDQARPSSRGRVDDGSGHGARQSDALAVAPLNWPLEQGFKDPSTDGSCSVGSRHGIGSGGSSGSCGASWSEGVSASESGSGSGNGGCHGCRGDGGWALDAAATQTTHPAAGLVADLATTASTISAATLEAAAFFATASRRIDSRDTIAGGDVADHARSAGLAARTTEQFTEIGIGKGAAANTLTDDNGLGKVKPIFHPSADRTKLAAASTKLVADKMPSGDWLAAAPAAFAASDPPPLPTFLLVWEQNPFPPGLTGKARIFTTAKCADNSATLYAVLWTWFGMMRQPATTSDEGMNVGVAAQTADPAERAA